MLGGGTESEQYIAGFDGEVGEGIEEEPEESDLRGAAGWKMCRLWFVLRQDERGKKGEGGAVRHFLLTAYLVDHTQRHRWLRLAAGRHHFLPSRICVFGVHGGVCCGSVGWGTKPRTRFLSSPSPPTSPPPCSFPRKHFPSTKRHQSFGLPIHNDNLVPSTTFSLSKDANAHARNGGHAYQQGDLLSLISDRSIRTPPHVELLRRGGQVFCSPRLFLCPMCFLFFI